MKPSTKISRIYERAYRRGTVKDLRAAMLLARACSDRKAYRRAASKLRRRLAK